MLGFLRVFFQKKNVKQIIHEKKPFSKSLFFYIISIAVLLFGQTIGTLLEQLILVPLGIQDIFTALFNTGTTFFVALLFIIPGIIGLALLVLIYFLFAKLLGGRVFDYFQFLSNFMIIAGSVGIVLGIVSVIPFLRHLINFVIVLYSFFLYIKLIREYFSLSTVKAFTVWFVPTLLLGLVVGLPILLASGIAYFLFFKPFFLW